MEILFLGTSSGIPTTRRNLPCMVLKRGREVLMFDCGEGTQRQMSIAKIGFNREMKIFITHMHGDHVLGLPGLLQTMSLLGRARRLEVFGPRGLEDFLHSTGEHVPHSLNFELEIHENSNYRLVDEEEYEVRCVHARHSIKSFAYLFIEKSKPGKFNPQKAVEEGVPEGPLWKKLQMGETISIGGRVIHPEKIVGPPRRGVKIVYTGDTRPCKSIRDQAEKADILVHDSTYSQDRGIKAREHMHSTSEEAAKIARGSGVEKLILTHISAIYDGEGCEEMLRQARRIFPNTALAEDFLSFKL